MIANNKAYRYVTNKPMRRLAMHGLSTTLLTLLCTIKEPTRVRSAQGRQTNGCVIKHGVYSPLVTIPKPKDDNIFYDPIKSKHSFTKA